MMTARDDTSTRPRKFNIMALLLAGSRLRQLAPKIRPSG